MTQAEKAQRLRELHHGPEPLLLINVWDAVSARIIEELGFPAIATTSAGVAFAEGFADGENIPRERMLARVRCITGAVDVPVTADLESGYGSGIGDAIQTARGAIESGAVGLNFEDFRGGELLDAALQCERISAIRRIDEELGVPLVINARTDVFLERLGDSDTWRLEEAVTRANAYLAAGADCAFVPGVADEATIAALVERIDGPINILANPAMPPMARLRELGVARISVGAASMAYALGKFRDAAREARETPGLSFADRISHAELNGLFSEPASS